MRKKVALSLLMAVVSCTPARIPSAAPPCRSDQYIVDPVVDGAGGGRVVGAEAVLQGHEQCHLRLTLTARIEIDGKLADIDGNPASAVREGDLPHGTNDSETSIGVSWWWIGCAPAGDYRLVVSDGQQKIDTSVGTPRCDVPGSMSSSLELIA